MQLSIKVIEVIIKNKMSISQLWQQNDATIKMLPFQLDTFLLWKVRYEKPEQYISGDLLENMNVFQLKSLQKGNSHSKLMIK